MPRKIKRSSEKLVEIGSVETKIAVLKISVTHKTEDFFKNFSQNLWVSIKIDTLKWSNFKTACYFNCVEKDIWYETKLNRLSVNKSLILRKNFFFFFNTIILWY